MNKRTNIRWMPALMAATILAIAAFQVYWLSKTWDREDQTLHMRTNNTFRESVRTLQASKLKLDKLVPDSVKATRITVQHELAEAPALKSLPREKMALMMDVIMQRTTDTSKPVFIIRKPTDSTVFSNGISPRQNRLMQFLFDVDSLQDSIRIKEIETTYDKKLAEQHLEVPFTISRVETKETDDHGAYNEVTVGFAHPLTYRLNLGNTTPYLLKRISPAILFSVFLVGFTLLSFMLLYRNLLRQRKLADIKAEFISNMTHELKTPIATVSVAIEALRNFNASVDPQKTKEYLDISALELQRLSLLVDKVLKLSMFENKEIELKHDALNMRQLADEVIASMRLQFEKRKATVSITSDGDTSLTGDKMHLVSVLYNLLDNALKYSRPSSRIDVSLHGEADKLHLSVTDNGIGIPPEYHQRIFEKFFRVPHGDVHNAKGYGLGLSYVAHVVEQHKGTIRVEAAPGGGSRFLIMLPRQAAV